MNAITCVDFSGLAPSVRLGVGGQGEIHRVQNLRRQGGGVVCKTYRPAIRPTVNFAALQRQTDFPASLTDDERTWLLSVAAWPSGVVCKDGVPVGFLMSELSANTFPPLHLKLPSGSRQNTTPVVAFLLRPPAWIRRIIPELRASDVDTGQLLAEIAACVARFHANGVLVGDLSPKNILFALHPRPACFFVDCDSMVLAGETALPPVETRHWDVGSVFHERAGTIEADRYKFALLVLRAIAGRQLARTAKSLPNGAPAAVAALLGRGLSRDANGRPTLAEWSEVLDATYRRPPTAAFDSIPTTGVAPLTVAFHDRSGNHPAQRQWAFGDGETSTLPNPRHTFRTAGTYIVRLTCHNQNGSSIATRQIAVKPVSIQVKQGTATASGTTRSSSVRNKRRAGLAAVRLMCASSVLGLAAVASYPFVLLEEGTPSWTISYGQTLDGIVASSSRPVTYRFAGKSGDTIAISLTALDPGGGVGVRLLDPIGTTVSSAGGVRLIQAEALHVIEIELRVSGTFEIVVGTQWDAPIRYRLGLSGSSPPSSSPTVSASQPPNGCPNPLTVDFAAVPVRDSGQLRVTLKPCETLIVTSGQIAVKDKVVCSASKDPAKICVLTWHATTAQAVTVNGDPGNTWSAVTSAPPRDAAQALAGQFWISPNCGEGCTSAEIVPYLDGKRANSYGLSR